jgi:2-polyprenyl-3-methyl-5-hydroxy-6-metoxy-1,4-benzoquinol methylase
VRCLLCQTPSENVARHRDRDVYRCPECQLAFLDPGHHVTNAEARAEYLLHDNTMECRGYVRMFEKKIATLGEHCTGISSVLDYGCGPGPVLVELLRRGGYDAYGYDPMFFADADLERTYDCVISTEVFEHFMDPAAEFPKVHRLVKPGGILAIMTLHHDDGTDLSTWWYLNVPSHVVFYSSRTFEWIADRYGYDFVHADDKRFVILRRRVA